MEITLEKIELVKDRTGVSYKEAKEALEAANGSVVDAIINIEESVDFSADEEAVRGFTNNEMFERIKQTAQKGHMSRIMIRKGDTTLLNIPLTAGLLGAVVAPWGVIFGIIVAAGFNCKVEFLNDKGEITDINGKVRDYSGSAKGYGQRFYGKGQETFDKIKESDLYADLKEKGEDTFSRFKDSDLYADFREKRAETFEKIKDGSLYEDLKEKVEGIDKEKVRENIEEIRAKAADLFKRKDGDEEIVDLGEVDADDFKEIRLHFGAPEDAPAEPVSDVSDIANAFSEAITDLGSAEAPEDFLEAAVDAVEESAPVEKGEEILQKAVDALDEEPVLTVEDILAESTPVDELIDSMNNDVAAITEDLKEIADAGDGAMDELARILQEVERESGLSE